MRTDNSSDIRDLLEENIRLSKETLAVIKKMERKTRWSYVFSILRIIIIIVPVVLALIYIPPFLDKFSDVFGTIYGGEQFNILDFISGKNGGVDLNELKSFINSQVK